MSGNIVTVISDHYAPFLLLQNLNNKNSTNIEIYHQDFKILNKNNIERDLVNTNLDAILEVMLMLMLIMAMLISLLNLSLPLSIQSLENIK